MAKPTRSVRIGNVQIAEWSQTLQNGAVVFNYTFTKSYKDKDGNWQNGTSFSEADLCVLKELIGKMLSGPFHDIVAQPSTTTQPQPATGTEDVPF